MEAWILDSNYETLGIIDAFESFIWTTRYYEAGDFELYLPVTDEAIELLKKDRYICRKDSDRYMIIENIKITASSEDGDHMTVTGRSLESILDRRIVWDKTELKSSIDFALRKVVIDSFVSPAMDERKVSNFSVSESSDTAVTSVQVDLLLKGDNVYDVVSSNCFDKKIGFKVLPKDDGGFEFSLYAGKDRSFAQDVLPWVIFSPKYDNFVSSEYIETNKLYKNVVLGYAYLEIRQQDAEGGEYVRYQDWNEEIKRTTDFYASGLDRRESFVGDLDPQTVNITDADVNGVEDLTEILTKVRVEANEILAETDIEKAYTGEIDATIQFVYGRDFFLGDIVQVQNEYGMESTSRIVEIVESQDANGYRLIPTFLSIYDDKEAE